VRLPRNDLIEILLELLLSKIKHGLSSGQVLFGNVCLQKEKNDITFRESSCLGITESLVCVVCCTSFINAEKFPKYFSAFCYIDYTVMFAKCFTLQYTCRSMLKGRKCVCLFKQGMQRPKPRKYFSTFNNFVESEINPSTKVFG